MGWPTILRTVGKALGDAAEPAGKASVSFAINSVPSTEGQDIGRKAGVLAGRVVALGKAGLERILTTGKQTIADAAYDLQQEYHTGLYKALCRQVQATGWDTIIDKEFSADGTAFSLKNDGAIRSYVIMRESDNTTEAASIEFYGKFGRDQAEAVIEKYTDLLLADKQRVANTASLQSDGTWDLLGFNNIKHTIAYNGSSFTSRVEFKQKKIFKERRFTIMYKQAEAPEKTQ